MRHSRVFAPIAVFALLVVSVPGPAVAAQGLSVAWNHCFGEPAATQNAAFACDVNTGSHTMVGGFVLSSPMAIVIGWEGILDLASSSPVLPAWWEFKNAGTCRTGSLGFGLVPDPADLVCEDWAAGLSSGGIGGYCTLANAMPAGCGLPGQPANTARIKVIAAVAPSNAQDLAAGQEYFAFALRMDHAKTVGTGSCAGCQTPVCIVFNSINVVARDNVENRFLIAPTAPGANYITWQGGGNPVGGGGIGCPAATPARRSTWGAVKTLYR